MPAEDPAIDDAPSAAPVVVGGPQSRAVHLVGAAGAGLRALAEYLHDSGWRVTGSDASPGPQSVGAFARIAAPLHGGHSAENLPSDAGELVYSAAVPSENPERVAAKARGVPASSYPQRLGRLTREQPTVAIAGTHGKSTTTALLATVLDAAGMAAGMLCGAEDRRRRRHGWRRPQPRPTDWLVVEACEYRRHFLELSPQAAVLLGVEPDHFDCFPTLSEALSAYGAFLDRLPSGAPCVLSAEGAAPQALAGRSAPRPVLISGPDGPAEWTYDIVEHSASGLQIAVRRRGEVELRLRSRLLGRQHAINLLAAAVLARLLGAPCSAIVEGLEAFGGLHRRLERLSDFQNGARYDDYAHHPTAVRSVLQAVRELHPQAPVHCVFQPHQSLRTDRLREEFARALGLADLVTLLPVYAAREAPGVDVSLPSRRLAERIVAVGGDVRFCPSLDHLRTSVETAFPPGTTLITLGAGDIDRLHDHLS